MFFFIKTLMNVDQIESEVKTLSMVTKINAFTLSKQT